MTDTREPHIIAADNTVPAILRIQAERKVWLKRAEEEERTGYPTNSTACLCAANRLAWALWVLGVEPDPC